MQLLLKDGVIYCPLCDQPMELKRERFYRAHVATHRNPSCKWGSIEFRVDPKTGHTEKLTGMVSSSHESSAKSF